MIELTDIRHRFGEIQALDGVNLSIRRGEFFGLLGPNGAGKSTLMNLLSGFLQVQEGAATIDGHPTSEACSPAKMKLGLVPQQVALYEDLSAIANLQIFAGLYGLTGAEKRDRIGALLEAVQLADRAKDQVKNFSGGMKRRLNIAASLIHEPDVLLCDEPTVGVDPQSRNAIFDFIEARHAAGLTVIYTTHYMEEAERLCSRIGIIDHGKLLALGTLDELLEAIPWEEEVQFPRTPDLAAMADRLERVGTFAEESEAYRFRPTPPFGLAGFYTLAKEMELPSRLFTVRRPTLESLFLELTGRSLRE